MTYSFVLNGRESKPSVETTGLLASAEGENSGLLSSPSETIGALSLLNAGAMSNSADDFGGKDFFGTPDYSNMAVENLAYNGTSSAETIGSLACADFGGTFNGGGVSSFDGGACASVGAGTGAGASCGSCGGGSFASVC